MLKRCQSYNTILLNDTIYRRPPSKEVVAQFWNLYKTYVSRPSDAAKLDEMAVHLASALLVVIPWAGSFLPPTQENRTMLSNLLRGYILAVEGRSGWRLEVDPRLLISFYVHSTNQAFLPLKFPIFRWPNQAKIVATRKYKIGDVLQIEGFTAPLTEREERLLAQEGRLFSVGHGK